MNIHPKRIVVLALCIMALVGPAIWITMRNIAVDARSGRGVLWRNKKQSLSSTDISSRENISSSARLTVPSSGQYKKKHVLSLSTIRYNVTSTSKPKCNPLIRLYDFSRNTTDKFNCVLMKTASGKIPMCIHPLEKDRWVSGAIQMYGIWEGGQASLFQMILKQNPGMNVVDLGAQLGMYSLLAANMGRAVLAVEPMLENVRRLHKSVQLNGFQDRITLAVNGLSDKRGVSVFERESGNVGGTKMLDQNQNLNITDQLYGVDMTQSIYLDDLIPICQSQKLFIKIDVEGSEGKVINSGHAFFLRNDIHYVMMEWKFIKVKPEAKSLINFFQTYDLEPHSMGSQLPKLNLSDYSKWPQDILWIRKIKYEYA